MENNNAAAADDDDDDHDHDDDDVQEKQKNPFYRPAEVDPVEHRRNTLDYLSYLSQCCRRSDLYNHSSAKPKNNSCDLNSLGTIVALPKFNYLPPTESRCCNDVNCCSSITDVSMMPVKDRFAGDNLCLPDLETNDKLTDCNHNVTSTKKRLLLPAVSEINTRSVSSTSAQQKAAFANIFVASGDGDFEARDSVGCNRPASKKQVAGPKRATNSTVKEQGVKYRAGRGRDTTRAQKEQTGGESKRPRKPRKAKSAADTQMKLSFVSDPTIDISDYDDALADDVYAFENAVSPEKKVMTSCSYSRRQHKKAAGADGHSLPPLAQRIYNNMQLEPSQVMQSQLGVQYPSSFTAAVSPLLNSSSQRSSYLFDAMLEQQAKPREDNHHSLITEADSISQSVEVVIDKESVPRYCCRSVGHWLVYTLLL